MKLFLHIGTEKTGSSYLQSIAAINRQQLRNQGIWYPYGGKRERDMVSGRISPGNAQVLADASNRNHVRHLLKKWVQETKDQDCSRLLLSNELLALKLSSLSAWKILIDAAKEQGIDLINHLLILRDPVDLALSLYKHHAKRGTVAQIEDWIVNDFDYSHSLGQFFQHVAQLNPALTCRRYKATDGYLERVFFTDWLGVSDSMKSPKGKINPSLNFSELSLIKSLRSHHPYLPEVLYERLLKVPQKDKVPEPGMESYYRSVIARELTKYESIWKECQTALPDNEHLDLPDTVAAVDHTRNVVTLAPLQVDIISGLLRDSLRLGFRWQLMGIKTRRRLGRLKNRIITLLDGKK